MKKAFLILSLLFVIVACKTPVYYIGMTEAEFKSHTKWRADLVVATADRAIYRIEYPQLNAPPMRKLYVFVNGKLVEITAELPGGK